MQNVIDDMYEAMDARDKLFDQVDAQYDYLSSMAELLYGEKAYAMQARIALSQAHADEQRLKNVQEEYRINHEMLSQLEEGSEEYKKALEKEQDRIRKNASDFTCSDNTFPFSHVLLRTRDRMQ